MKRTLLFLFVLVAGHAVGQPFRYHDKIFNEVDTLKEVEYATAPWLNNPIALLSMYNIHEGEMTTEERPLLMDIYLPKADTLEKRPAVVFVHGGAFILGSRQNEDMVALCDSFARRGYVTASIDYRLGMSAMVTRFFGIITQIHVPKSSGIRALYRATQDGRAAIRFLKHNAAEYRIDTTNIFMVGSSAGAITGLNNIYVDRDEVPPEAKTAPVLGNPDTIGINGYGSEADALVSYWGAVETPEIIDSTDTPLFLVHGKEDNIVPFKKGVPLEEIVPPNQLITFNMPETYGSFCIDTFLNNRNITPETWFVENKKHEFYGVNTGSFAVDGPNAYWDTTIWKTSEFLFDQFRPDAGFEITQTGKIITTQNYSSANHYVLWDFGDGTTGTEWLTEHSYNLPGRYTVSLTVCNGLMACDTASQTLSVGPTGIQQQPHEFIRIYPVPAGDQLHIEGIAGSFYFEIYDLTGRLRMKRKAAGKKTVDVSSLKPGVYILKLNTNDSGVVKKFIKRE